MSEPSAANGNHPPKLTWVIVGGLALVALALVLGWRLGSSRPSPSAGTDASAPADAIGTSLAIGGPAPVIRRQTLDGHEIGLSDYNGKKVVLVDFWATWCGPCHLQAKILHPLYDEYRARGVEFLAISLGEDGKTVQDFVAETPYPYPVLIDPEDTLATQFQIGALPTVLVIGRDGKVSYLHQGVTDAGTLRRVLAQAGAA